MKPRFSSRRFSAGPGIGEPIGWARAPLPTRSIHAGRSRASANGGSGFCKSSNRTLGLGCFFLGVLPAETLHAAGGVHELLLAGEERMAIGADFYVDVTLVSRARSKVVAARAHDADFVVSGMNGCFHDLLTSVPNHSILKERGRIQQMRHPEIPLHERGPLAHSVCQAR